MNDMQELLAAFRRGLFTVDEFRAMAEVLLSRSAHKTDCGDYTLTVVPAWGNV